MALDFGHLLLGQCERVKAEFGRLSWIAVVRLMGHRGRYSYIVAQRRLRVGKPDWSIIVRGGDQRLPDTNAGVRRHARQSAPEILSRDHHRANAWWVSSKWDDNPVDGRRVG